MAKTASLIFVTGASRSGTTLMSRVLGTHSRVLGLKEIQFFGDLWRGREPDRQLPRAELVRLAGSVLARQSRDVWGGPPNAEEAAKAAALVDALLPNQRTAPQLFAAAAQLLATDEGKTIACEQTPRNIFYACDLLDWYPDARIVHMVRDPRAVLASQKNRWRLRGLGAPHIPVSETVRTWINYHPFTMCRLWNAADEAAARLQDHPRVMVIRFEQLTAEPQRTAEALCDFLGLPYEPGVTDVPLWGSSNVTHRDDRKGIARDVSEQWRGVLSGGEVAVCERLTQRGMERHGYQRSKSPRTTWPALLPAAMLYPLHLAGVVLVNPHRAWIQAKALLLGRLGSAPAG